MLKKPTEWTIEAKKGGASELGPLKLTLMSCRVLNDDSDCSTRYKP